KTGGNNAGAIQNLGGDRPQAVQAVLDGATDASWASRRAMQLNAEATHIAYESFRTAVTLNSRNAEALAGLVAAAASARKQPETLDWLKTIASREPSNAPIRIELSHLYAAGGDGNAAIEAASA